MKSIALTTLMAMGIVFTTAFAAAPPEIKVGGGGAACKGFFDTAKESFEAETGIRLTIEPTSPSQGLIDLAKGNVDIATAAVPFSVIQKDAARKGTMINPGECRIAEIGINHTMVFLHTSNKVNELSKMQLRDIFTGKVRNWEKMGGDNREIVVVWGKGTPGQNELFTREILDGELVVKDALQATDYSNIREIVARTPGAIAIDPQGYASAVTKNPKTPPVTAPVIAVTRMTPSSNIEKLLAYIKGYKNW
jgi:phosphate transport system substrate-binding protein